jgi:protein-S-isoprenylcysteine O-methyltransferase Ste14
MTIASVVVPACWLIFLLYWAVSARSVKPTEEGPRGIGGYWHYLLWAFVFIVLQNLSVSPLTLVLVPHSLLTNILSSVCAVSGLAIAIVARRTLADNWSGVVTFKRDHELVTHGIYHYVRHPIYTGVLLMFISTLLLVGTLGIVLGFLVIFLGLWLKSKQEEALMERHFPAQYPEYKRRVKALIPFVF